MNHTNRAVAAIMQILIDLPSPRHAAAAIATVRANLFIRGGATSSERVCQMMNEDDKAAIEIWETIGPPEAKNEPSTNMSRLWTALYQPPLPGGAVAELLTRKTKQEN